MESFTGAPYADGAGRFGCVARGHPRRVAASGASGSVVAGALVGVGLMAGIDEIIFHQLLGWHHLYDRGTVAAGLTADGVLHLVEIALYGVGATFLYRLVIRRQVAWPRVGAGVLIGAGGFQLFDGIVDHKVLRLHQIRYGVELWPYDLAWNAAAVVLLAAGVALLRRTRPQSTVNPTERGTGPASE